MGLAAITPCILYILLAVVSAEFNSTPEHFYCGAQIQLLSDYQTGMEQVIRDLISSTPRWRFNYYNRYENGDTRVYGHGICNGLLSIEECSDCLRTVNAYRIHYCAFVVTAQAMFVDCELTFHNQPFYHGGPSY